MSLVLKKVTREDCDLLFKWVNDKEVRNSAFNTNIVRIEEHMKWFENKFSSDNCYMFICYNGELPIGQIRLDIKGNMGKIDYSIEEKYRGNNYGNEILGLIEKETLKIDILIGEVKYSNIASQKAFEKNNYKKNNKKFFICYSKELENMVNEYE